MKLEIIDHGLGNLEFICVPENEEDNRKIQSILALGRSSVTLTINRRRSEREKKLFLNT